MSTSSETVPEVFDPSKQSRKFRQLRSKPIRFIIGKEREGFYLNSGFLSQLSQSLNDIVRNNIVESSQSCIVWEDFDPTVFEQFAEFAYTGDYTCNLPTKLGKDTSEPPKRYTDDTFTLPYSLISYNTSAQNRRGMVVATYHGPKVNDRGNPTCGCCPSQMTQYFISAFLSQYCGSVGTGTDLTQNHAAESVEHLIGDVQMYIIADRYTITSLMDKAMSKLTSNLAKWSIVASAFIPQFRRLVDYVYTNTPGHGQPRQVVASFAVCVARDVSALEGWATLLEDVPDFAWDLLGQVTKRRPVSPQPMVNSSQPLVNSFQPLANSSQPVLGFPFGRKPQGYN
ncbi:hypothetical protein NPX13_g2260 [Xylaria arbuscula]|uniref:BTB domain-containing protein n=1 Tax=Xylaria arbuscula TaxID=114810 RepID=A0A9W8TNW7_9PEZI|nr:hypothetical protein NPX13_g2260 [Xylaria arbuscula]